MTPGLYVEFIIQRDGDGPDFDDKDTFGDTVREAGWIPGAGTGYVRVRVEAEWIEHDGEGGVYARFVGAEDDAYLSDDTLPVWKVMVE